MNGTRKRKSLFIVGLLLAAGPCAAQRIDPQIERPIAAIQAIDDHAHPVLAPPDIRGNLIVGGMP